MLFLVILTLPEIRYAGMDRGAAIWRLLQRVLESPFEGMVLVASKLRGKAKLTLEGGYLLGFRPGYLYIGDTGLMAGHGRK